MSIGAIDVMPDVDPVETPKPKVFNDSRLLTELRAAGVPAVFANSDGYAVCADGTENTDDLLAKIEAVKAAHDPVDRVKEKRRADLDAARGIVSAITLSATPPKDLEAAIAEIQSLKKIVTFLMAEYQSRSK